MNEKYMTTKKSIFKFWKWKFELCNGKFGFRCLKFKIRNPDFQIPYIYYICTIIRVRIGRRKTASWSSFPCTCPLPPVLEFWFSRSGCRNNYRHLYCNLVLRPTPPLAPRCCDAPAVQCLASRRARGRPHTWPPSWPTELGPCICCWWLVHDVCAVRGFATSTGKPGYHPHPWEKSKRYNQIKYFVLVSRKKKKKRLYDISTHLVTPTTLPGISRTRAFLQAMNAACGPPYPSGVPNRWLVPTTMSTLYSPGGLIRVNDSRSAAHTTRAC